MGIDKVKRERREAKSKRAKSRHDTAKNFITIRPSKDQKEAIKKSNLTVGEALTEIMEHHYAAASFTIQQQAARDGYVALLRDKNAKWDEAITLAAFHSDWHRCLQIMAYALSGEYRDFPDIGIAQLSMPDDW